MTPEPVIAFSAVGPFVRCVHQCALIHCAGVWFDNAHTVRRTRAHRRVDGGQHRTQRGRRVLRGLLVWSQWPGPPGDGATLLNGGNLLRLGVSPEFRLRPLLSVRGILDSDQVDPRVAGVQAPAFVAVRIELTIEEAVNHREPGKELFGQPLYRARALRAGSMRSGPTHARCCSTPAVWSGLSLPGLVEHLVIPRIPFRAPSVVNEAKRRFLASLGLDPSGIECILARDRSAAARRTLAQGMGRGIRGPDERCTLWLLDARFPLSKSMTGVIGGPGQGLAARHLDLMWCVPARCRTGWRHAVDQGRIWLLEGSRHQTVVS